MKKDRRIDKKTKNKRKDSKEGRGSSKNYGSKSRGSFGGRGEKHQDSRYGKRREEHPRYEHSDFKERDDIVVGRNAVMEALKSGRAIERICIQEGNHSTLGEIISLSKELGLRVDRIPKSKLNAMCGGAAHQGILATVAAHDYSSVDEILNKARSKDEAPFVIVLDNLEDPHNLGAIMRTAECAGAHGVIIGKHGSVGLTETVAKASAGAIEYVPCAKVTNIAQTIEDLQKEGLWVGACDMGEELYYQRDLKGPIAIVIGSEGKGISRLVKEKCDFTLSIPMKGSINSLNASNAAAIIAYEVTRQRDGKGNDS